MTISMIAAIGKNYELGKNNDLIWHFSADMKFFKNMTTGNTVVMGRKTFESLPHALPNRRNIVLTNNKDLKIDGVEVCHTIDEVLELCKNDNVFIIGGGKIYNEFLELSDKLYLTEIDDTCDDAKVYFPRFDKELYKRELIAENTDKGIKFDHVLYTRKNK